MATDEPDVIVIGAGAGGMMAAYGLVQTGMRVLLLEAGPRFNPGRDFAVGIDGFEFKRPFQKYLPDTWHAVPKPYPPDYDHLRTDLYPTPTQRGIVYERACGVGGSTLRYHAEAHRFPPEAFKTKTFVDKGTDWPLSYDDLAPYYERAEWLLGVSGQPHAAFPKQGPYPNPPHPFSPSSRLIASGCEKLGFELWPNPLAILSRPYQGRLPCVYCKSCVDGCVVGDKSSVDVAILPKIEATGQLKLRSGTTALQIFLDKKDNAQGVLAANVKTGQLETIKSRIIVLSLGAIETPRILLNSSCSRHPDGLCNSSGLVGKHLMENIHAGVVFYLDRKMETYKGLPIDGKVFDFMVPKAGARPAIGFTISAYGAPDFAKEPSTFALWLAKGYGKAHREFVEKYFGAHVMVFATAEHFPDASNALYLSKEKDRFGFPKALLDVALTVDDFEMLERMLLLTVDLATASGAVKIAGQMTSLDDASASHVGGTARMGLDAKTSVVNGYGQCHEIKNLFITDASVLPTQGCGLSPSLTIQALALRTADFIAQEAKRQSL
jgi:choline dehydrogenase-like flavoprotein